jgi:uncharacterized protein (DUF486 family)
MMKAIPISIQTVLPLTASDVFMTFAWVGAVYFIFRG